MSITDGTILEQTEARKIYSTIPVSYTVYKSGSNVYANATEAGGTDYDTTGGSTVTQVIQNAIDATPIGRKITIKTGAYYLPAALSVTKPLIIEGEACGIMGSTVYGTILTTTAYHDAIQIDPTAASIDWGVTLKDLCLRGKYSGVDVGRYGLNIMGSAATGKTVNRCNFYNMVIQDFVDFGLYAQTGHSNQFWGCKFISNGQNVNTGNIILGVTGEANCYGFHGCQIEWSPGCGLINKWGYGSTIDGASVIEGNYYHGIHGYSTPGSGMYPQFMTIRDSYFELNNMATAANIRDIYIADTGAAYWSIRNVQTSGDKVDYSVYNLGWFTTIDNFRGIDKKIFWNSSYGSIINTDVGHVAAGGTFGTTVVLLGSGFQSRGTSTGTGAQQTIAHGLGGAPDYVWFSNIEDGANPYQSAPADAVNIYVTATLNQDYAWKAEYVP